MKEYVPSASAPVRRTFGESGFLNLRVLIDLFVILAGVFLALLGFGAFSAQAQQKYRFVLNSMDPLGPPGFDCAKIDELGIDKQENLRAGAIMIGAARQREAQHLPVTPSRSLSKICCSPQHTAPRKMRY